MSSSLEFERLKAQDLLPAIDDLRNCNRLLTEAGRPDLVIKNRVDHSQFIQVNTPQEVDSKLNNFAPQFNFEYYLRTPISEEQLWKLRVEPEYMDELFQHNKIAMALTHVLKPSFHRMLVLFPDFAIKLVSTFGESRRGFMSQRINLDTEVLSAYQIMTRLVDKSDKYVLKGRKVDDYYFYH